MRREHGDRAGRELGRLYEQHGPSTFAYAMHLLRSRADAEDVVQTAFMHAYRALLRGEDLVNPRAWLATVVKRQAISRWQARREVPVEDPAVAVAAPERGDAALDLAEVERVLRSLPRSQHEAFVLRHWSGLSNREIASVLETSESAVESLLVRARAAIMAVSGAAPACADVRDRLASRRRMSLAERRHVSRCADCQTAKLRVSQVAAAAVVAGLLPGAHVAHALAASAPGFSATATGGAGVAVASRAGALAKLGGVKGAAVVVSALAVSAAPLAIPHLVAHARAHPAILAAARGSDADRAASAAVAGDPSTPVAGRPFTGENHRSAGSGSGQSDGSGDKADSGSGGDAGSTSGDQSGAGTVSSAGGDQGGTSGGDQGTAGQGDQGTSSGGDQTGSGSGGAESGSSSGGAGSGSTDSSSGGDQTGSGSAGDQTGSNATSSSDGGGA
jgi:RNA polymerase sigma factor (sigma-70 family)